MKQCYLCGLDFNGNTVKEHKEHIIQQAIGGSLTASSILCESCGSKLNDDIDKEFTKTFENTSVLLGIKRDRKDTSGKTIIGNHQAFIPKVQEILDERKISVIWADSKVYPNKPFEVYSDDRKRITIYARSGTDKHYRIKVEKEFKLRNPNAPLPVIEVCNDLYGVTSFKFELKNREFKRGMAKIAVNYASSHGVPRNELDLILDIAENNNSASFIDKPPVFSFYPLGIIDKLIEAKKSEFQPYPTHTLLLFNRLDNPKTLVCYVELFSTFQCYVILSENYSGSNIYKFYTQKLLPEEEIKFEPDRDYHKSRSGILSSLGISEEDINNSYINRVNEETKEEVEFKMIEFKMNQQRYNISLEDHLESIINEVLLEKVRNLNGDFDITLLSELMHNKDLFFYTDENNETKFNIASFRRYFIDSNGKHISYPYEISLKKQNEIFLKALTKYNHKKFYDLQEFFNTRNIDKKQSD